MKASVQLSADGNITVDRLINQRAKILQDSERIKLLDTVSMLLRVTGKPEADSALVLEAAKIVLPDVYEVMWTPIADPERFDVEWTQPKRDKAAYLQRGIRLERWPSANRPPTKKPDETKVIALCASPRKKGNTQYLINKAIEGIKSAGVTQVESINISLSDLGYCIDCNQCLEKDLEHHCVLKDDMTKKILPGLIDADVVIMGFPIYCGRESAPMAALFDRFHCVVGRGLLRGKRGMVICTWGNPTLTNYQSVMGRIIDHLEHFGVEIGETIAASCLMGILLGFDESKNPLVANYPEETRSVFEAGKALIEGTN